MYAARAGRLDIVKILVDNEADVNFKDEEGQVERVSP